jgi:hypothetical protein
MLEWNIYVCSVQVMHVRDARRVRDAIASSPQHTRSAFPALRSHQLATSDICSISALLFIGIFCVIDLHR